MILDDPASLSTGPVGVCEHRSSAWSEFCPMLGNARVPQLSAPHFGEKTQHFVDLILLVAS